MTDITGTESSDVLTGTSGDDTITGLGGSDQIAANGGNDVVYGGAGDDRIEGGLGDDQIYGGLDRDTLVGGQGSDLLDGGDGDDYLTDSNNGSDTLRGGAGNDTIYFLHDAYGATETILIDAGAGDDSVNFNYNSSYGSTTIDLGDGADQLTLGTNYQGSTRVTLGTGQDRITISDFANFSGSSPVVTDFTTGTAGDVLDLNAYLTRQLINWDGSNPFGTGGFLRLVQQGTSTVLQIDRDGASGTSSGLATLITFENTTVGAFTAANFNGFIPGGVSVGTNANDTLAGGSLADELYGLGGNDNLSGGDGADILDGGSGADALSGGAGNDIYVVDDGGDSITENFGEGMDTVRSSISYTLGANVEGLQLVGSATLNGSGIGLDNEITGNQSANVLVGLDGSDRRLGLSGDDSLFGGTGNDALEGSFGQDLLVGEDGDDRLEGGDGNDELSGGNGNDLIDGGAGIDRASFGGTSVGVQVSLAISGPQNTGQGTDTLVNIENLLGSGHDDYLTGNSGANSIFGGNGNDFLDGGAGSDTLTGGLGDDFYVVDNSLDVAVEGFAEGTDAVSSSVSFTLAANFEILDLTGANAINGTGNALGNIINGNSSSNVIAGLDGHDTISGGAGADRLSGGAGNDTFRDTAAGLTGDTITDFGAGDRIVIRDASLASFTFSLSGNTLTYSGGALTLSSVPVGRIAAQAATGGGVELSLATRDPADDFNGDGRSDILWRENEGAITTWLGRDNGGFVNNDANALRWVPRNWQIADTGDFNGDGRDDVLWRESDGAITTWLGQANGSFTINDANALQWVPRNWQIASAGDFNGDGRDDILWRESDGAITTWLGQANGGFANNDANALRWVPRDWKIADTGDFNGDGRDDILWREKDGAITTWLGQANGSFVINDANALQWVPQNWQIAGTGDFNGDGRHDILWRESDGAITTWLGQANGGFANNDANALEWVPTNWNIADIGDYNGDGRDDILWREDRGAVTTWLGDASGGFANNDANALQWVPLNWHVQNPDILL
jgi:Ca2+-binding RTX toxin-like protein